jgi:hypothetical protein
MVVHESFVTRKPLEFMLIVLVIVLILLLPLYFYTKNRAEAAAPEGIIVAESYGEVAYIFGPDSDLSESDKKHLFRFNYENNIVQWSGTLVSCEEQGGLFRLSVDHDGDGFGNVLFRTFNNCTGIPPGSAVTYKMTLIDLKVRTFIGKDGEVTKWA